MEAPANDDLGPQARRSIREADLDAYVTGRLDDRRRAEVEGFLACNPDLAASVMNSLHRRGQTGGASRPRTARIGGILAGGLCALAVAAGVWWGLGRYGLGGPGEPRYVQEAVMSHRTSMLRAAMTSQVETPNVDPGEISREAKLRMPALPQGWKVLDAQIFPSDDGPSLFLLVDAGAGRRLGLFAVRSDTIVSDRPIVARSRGDYLAYWETGDFAYVLTGARSRGEVAAEARELAANTSL